MSIISKIVKKIIGKNSNDRVTFVRIPGRMPKKFRWMPRSIDASLQYVAESFDLPLEQMLQDVKKGLEDASFSKERIFRYFKREKEDAFFDASFSVALKDIAQEVLVKTSADYSHIRDSHHHFLGLIKDILDKMHTLDREFRVTSEWSDVYLMIEILRELLDVSYEDKHNEVATSSGTFIREKYGGSKKKR